MALGIFDRLAAAGLAYLWACQFGWDPFSPEGGWAVPVWLLVGHNFLPTAPYGSVAARGRPDPGGGWRKPALLHLAGYVLLTALYLSDGISKLVDPLWRDGTAPARVLFDSLATAESRPLLDQAVFRGWAWVLIGLELGFGPLSLFPRTRRFVWDVLLLVQLAALVLHLPSGPYLGLVLLHLFTFDPAWVPPAAGPTEHLFYDGHCGLCHRGIRFVLAEDRTGTAFRFAPLDGDTFAALVPPGRRAALPDSVVVRTATGDLLVRSAAVLHVARRLGGVWRLLGGAARVVPAAVWDRLYDLVAGTRHRLFERPAEACPLVRPELRRRFDG